MSKEQMVIFTRTYDLLLWLLPRCEKFPKSQRFVMTKRLQDAALDFLEALYHANARRGKFRVARLEDADACLNMVRLYLRLSYEWGWLTGGQYQHVSKMVAEIGRLLGGWMKQSKGG